MYPQMPPMALQHLSSIQNKWPYIQCSSYSPQRIPLTFPHLSSINKPLVQQQNRLGLIIRSANDDNVHKAIKYGIWTTTPKNRQRLEHLWQKGQKDGTGVYLFFSVVKSGMFQGVARLKSDLNEETFPFWWENHSLKFKGYFQIEWVYIKDVNYKHFQGLLNMDGQQVTKSKDCDLLDNATTNQMIQIYSKRPLKRYIFDDFQKMDDRQKNYTRKMYQCVVLQQHQQYYQTYNYKPVTSTYTNQVPSTYVQPQQNLTANILPTMMPLPTQMMRPANLDPKSANSLGFQMNPVSKNRKK